MEEASEGEATGGSRVPTSASPGSTRIARRILPLLLLLGLSCVFGLELREPRPQLDDAYISYRYARNLVEGHGLVYNPGEYVEGYTNLLWTLMVAAGLALGAEAKSVGHALGVASGLALLVATHLYARALLGRAAAWLAPLPVALVLASTSFAYWSGAGMETPLFAAAIALALAAFAGDRIGWALAAVCVASLTRADGVLIGGVLVGFHLAGSGRRGLRAWRGPLVYAGLLLALTAFRLAYYGSPLPNTFYAKVGGLAGGRGLEQLADFLRAGAAWLLAPAGLAAVADRRARPGAVFAGISAVYLVAVGGDAFPFWRFLLPALVCASVLAVRGAEIAWRRSRALGGAAGLACVAYLGTSLLGGWPPPSGETLGERLRSGPRLALLARKLQHDAFAERMGLERARAFAQLQPPPRLVAVSAIGLFGYHTRLPILDVYGLVDPVIARSRVERTDLELRPGHARSNADYVLAREPEFIVMPRRREVSRYPALAALWEHPGFQRHYAWSSELRAYARTADAAGSGRGAGAMARGRPNIVLAVVDTLRADALGAYGNAAGATPNLDALARSGTVYRDARSVSSWTRPSVASMLTGLHPEAHGAVTRADALSPELAVLPELLARSGYATGAFVANPNVGSFYGFARGFDHFAELYERSTPGLVDSEEPMATADVVVERALAWIDRVREPFFLLLLPIDPHDPYQPPEGSDRRGAGRAGDALGYRRSFAHRELSEDDRARVRSLYGGEVAFTDAMLGRLLRHLEERGLDERTAVILTSDHGEEFWEHGRVLHGKTLFEESLRVPLIVRIPGRRVLPPERGDPVEGVDLFPTLLEIAGSEVPAGTQGRSLLGPERQRRAYASLRLGSRSLRALVEPPWKLVRDVRGDRDRLYHLERDPGERRDLSGRHPEIAGRLGRALDALARVDRERGVAAPQRVDADLPPEQRALLEALGYLPDGEPDPRAIGPGRSGEGAGDPGEGEGPGAARLR